MFASLGGGAGPVKGSTLGLGGGGPGVGEVLDQAAEGEVRIAACRYHYG
ncbi:hypothetical protein [Microbacterium sp. A93]